MARSNRKDPEYIAVRVFDPSGRLDTTFKAQRFDARSDARDFVAVKNAARRSLRKKYRVIPAFPGPVNRKK